MIKLKDMLNVSYAHEFKIKDLDTKKIVWNDAKGVDGYDEMLEKYSEYEVVVIKARTSGRALNGTKSILAIEIQNNDML